MKKLVALEELAQLAASFYFIAQLTISINYYLLVPGFFAPDLFALGYLINRKVGAFSYNFSHHKLIAIILIAAGYLLKNEYWQLAGLLTYAHSSFDRTIGYGLKYADSPDRTHLGFIGREKFKNPPDTL